MRIHGIIIGITVGLLMSFQGQAQNILERGSEFSADTGPWGNWATSTSNLTARSGYLRVMTPADPGDASLGLGGIALLGGMPVDAFPPPWHMEVALERPTADNTAIGWISQTAGYQFLHNQLTAPCNGRTAFYGTAAWAGTPKGPPMGPNTSAIPEASLAGARLIFYLGAVNDTTMRYGVRASEANAWSFAPDYDIGFSLVADPVFFPDLKIMIENRDGWFFTQYCGQHAPTSETTDVDIDYVRFGNTLDTLPVPSIVPVPTPVPVAAVLLIEDVANGNHASDLKFQKRLESIGAAVTVLDDDAATTGGGAAGKDLIVISSTVGSAKIAAKYRGSAVPVIVWENALFDDFNMTLDTASVSHGATAGKTLSIINSAHPLAGGLAGDVTAVWSSTNLGWGAPTVAATGAIKVATLPTDSAKYVILGYNTGGVMENGFSAPARRVGIFLGDETGWVLTDDGWKLFEAAVKWATNNLIPLVPNTASRWTLY